MSIPHSPYIAYNKNQALINSDSSPNNIVVVAKNDIVKLNNGKLKVVVIFSRVSADKLEGNKFDCKLGSGTNAVAHILNRIENNPKLKTATKENLILLIKSKLIPASNNNISSSSPDWKGDLLTADTFDQIHKHIKQKDKIEIADIDPKELTNYITDSNLITQTKPSALSLDDIKNLNSNPASAPSNRSPPLAHSAEKKEPPKIKPQLPPRAPLPDWLNFKKND
jgi:hypothetical protein